MIRRSSLMQVLVATSLVAVGFGCSKNNDTNNSGCTGANCGGPNSGGGGGQSATQIALNLNTVPSQLLVMDNQQGTTSLMLKHNETVDKLNLKNTPKFIIPEDEEVWEEHKGLALTGVPKGSYVMTDGRIFKFRSEESFGLAEDSSQGQTDRLVGLDTDHNPSALIGQATSTNTQPGQPTQELPFLTTVAIAPSGDMYLQFQNSFVYKDVPSGTNGWDQSKGYQCQLFRIPGSAFGSVSSEILTPDDPSKMVCVNNTHFINNWGGSNNVYQFDGNNNIYYAAFVPGGTNSIVFKALPSAYDANQDVAGNFTEVINKNICTNNYLVMKAGGVFYTGSNCSNGRGGGGNNGFFKYITPKSTVATISTGWGQYIYSALAGADAASDSAVFFGPDPQSATSASWQSACLFNFSLKADGSTPEFSNVITCGNDIWNWLNMTRTIDVETYGSGYFSNNGGPNNSNPSDAWKSEYKHRCESDSEVFAGGGSQISAIQQTTAGDVYVVGNVQKKVKGEITCNVQIRGPHCVISTKPELYDSNGDIYTPATCQDANGVYLNNGQWDNNATDKDGTLMSKILLRSWTFAGGQSGDWGTGTCSTSSSDQTEIAAVATYTRKNDCVPKFSTNPVWYNSVSGDICSASAPGSTAQYVLADPSDFTDWNSEKNNFAVTDIAASGATNNRAYTAFADIKPSFIIQGMNCSPVSTSSSSSGGNQWTEEYQALAKVNKDTQSLELISLPTEQVSNLWIANDKPYFVSHDVATTKFYLSGVDTTGTCVDFSLKDPTSLPNGSSQACLSANWSDRRCLVPGKTTSATCKADGKTWLKNPPKTIVADFEAYTVASGVKDTEITVGGLNNSSNSYQFGYIDLSTTPYSITLNTKLTGTVKTVVIYSK